MVMATEMMKGIFGIETEAFGADLVSQILVVSGVNFFVGHRILKTTVVTKEVKSHGNKRAHGH